MQFAIRRLLHRLAAWAVAMTSLAAAADGSGRELASYYDRHMALVDGVAHGWVGTGTPTRLRAGVVQVGVGKDVWLALLDDGSLVAWGDAPGAAARPTLLMPGVASFAAGASGWFAIDRAGVLWHGTMDGSKDGGAPPRRIAAGVLAACIGDGADYYVDADGTLYAHGLAHRGQYGDGRLATSPGFVPVATGVVAVKAHTGHALHLRRDGVVMGTGGNRYGPLSSHGLGDKADRWGQVFDGARAIATGSRHSLAIRHDGGLWAWGDGFTIEPRRLQGGVAAAAAGDSATLALTTSGELWQWDRGGTPRRLELR
jgi:alpha-tubulin suppressor-like RCC1 family protein